MRWTKTNSTTNKVLALTVTFIFILCLAPVWQSIYIDNPWFFWVFIVPATIICVIVLFDRVINRL